MLLSACMSSKVGKELKSSQLSQIVEAKTSEVQLIALLGQPTLEHEGVVMGGWNPSCGKPGNSVRTLSYQFAVGRATGFMSSSSQMKTYSFAINKKGIVCKKQTQNMNLNAGFGF